MLILSLGRESPLLIQGSTDNCHTLGSSELSRKVALQQMPFLVEGLHLCVLMTRFGLGITTYLDQNNFSIVWRNELMLLMVPHLSVDLFEGLCLSCVRRPLPSAVPTSADLTVHTGSSTCAHHPLPRATTAETSASTPEPRRATLNPIT